MLGWLLRACRRHDRYLAWNRLDAAPDTVQLTSPAFADGAAMPQRFAGTGVGENLSPPLAIAGVPPDADALVLILQDPDAPVPRPVVHLIAWLAPATTALAEGALNAGAPIHFGRGSLGHSGYAGPRPVPGHGPHRYIFQLFAVRGVPPLPSRAGLKAVLRAINGHVIARGRCTGTYER